MPSPHDRPHKIDMAGPVVAEDRVADTLGDVTGAGVFVTIDRFVESNAGSTSAATVPAPSAGEA